MQSTLLILLTLTCQVMVKGVAHQYHLPLDPEQEECIEELHVDREQMAFFNTEEFPPEDNSNFNAFLTCTWKKQGYQYENGVINYKALKNMVCQDLLEQIGTSRSSVKLATKMSHRAVHYCRFIRITAQEELAVRTQNCVFRRLSLLAKEYERTKYNEKEKFS